MNDKSFILYILFESIHFYIFFTPFSTLAHLRETLRPSQCKYDADYAGASMRDGTEVIIICISLISYLTS